MKNGEGHDEEEYKRREKERGNDTMIIHTNPADRRTIQRIGPCNQKVRFL